MDTNFKVMDGQDPNRPDTYWSIGFRTARTGFLLKYVLVSICVFLLFVVLPLYIYEPNLFSRTGFKALSDTARARFWAKIPVAMLIVALPFCLSVAILIVGQIRRLHDFNKPGWLCVLNVVFPAAFGILLLLLFVPGTHGPNKYGEDPHERRKREAAEIEEKRRLRCGCRKSKN
jgi:uncharacterized membrane protein YhaH (DUF805 family)